MPSLHTQSRACQLPQKPPDLFEGTPLPIDFMMEALPVPLLIGTDAHADEFSWEFFLDGFQHRRAWAGDEYGAFLSFAGITHALARDDRIKRHLEFIDRFRLVIICINILESEVLPARMLLEEHRRKEFPGYIGGASNQEKHV